MSLRTCAFASFMTDAQQSANSMVVFGLSVDYRVGSSKNIIALDAYGRIFIIITIPHNAHTTVADAHSDAHPASNW